MTDKNKYFLCAVASYVIWGFLPIFFKQLAAYNYFEIIFYRVLISALILCVILLFDFAHTKKLILESYQKSKKEFSVMVALTTAGAALLAVNWVSYVYTVNEISIRTGAFAYLIVPIITALLSFVFLGEKLNTASWIAIFLSMVSCYILGNVSVKEINFVFIIALSYSFYLITQRKNTLLPRHISLGFQLIFFTLLLFFFHPPQDSFGALPAHFWLNTLIVALFFTVIPLCLNLYALNGMKTAQLSYIGYINPIIVFVIGVIIYKEKMTLLALLAYAFLAVAIVILNWDWIKRISQK